MSYKTCAKGPNFLMFKLIPTKHGSNSKAEGWPCGFSNIAGLDAGMRSSPPTGTPVSSGHMGHVMWLFRQIIPFECLENLLKIREIGVVIANLPLPLSFVGCTLTRILNEQHDITNEHGTHIAIEALSGSSFAGASQPCKSLYGAYYTYCRHRLL